MIGAFLISILNESNTETDHHSRYDEKQGENVNNKGVNMRPNDLNALLRQLSDEEQKLLLHGGPPPDGIPSIDNPVFTDVKNANTWLKKNEPIIFVQIGDDARAYPMQILMWHEIVNDMFDDVPVTITYCPLCNSSFSFLREIDEIIVDFGTTGYLYGGALLMYDRQTHTLWSHFGGKGLIGPLADNELQIVPSTIISWQQFSETFSKGKVLSRNTGFSRSYGKNPYVGYDDVNEPPFLFRGVIDGTFAPKERIVAIEYAGEAKAYLLQDLIEERVIHDELGGKPIVLFYEEGTASGLENETVAGGRDVGSTIEEIKRMWGKNLHSFSFSIDPTDSPC
jgi:hypothetical protein